MNSRVIAIDGPSGAGKSSVSRAVAKRLGFLHVDSGALYRIYTFCMLRDGVDTHDGTAVAAHVGNVRIDCKADGERIAFYVDNRELKDELRTPEINANASYVSAVQEVRDRITSLLRSLTDYGDLAVEGRDITTVVFADSPARFFLTADAEVRAMRRRKEELEKGIATGSVNDVKASLLFRDKIDSGRKCAPLRKADGVIQIDSTNLGFEEVVDAVMKSLPEDWKR